MAPNHMTWFQVTCPSCITQLQTKLPVGDTSVQCSQCKGVFVVQVQQDAMPPQQQQQQAPPRRCPKKDGDTAVSPALQAYHDFMKPEMRRLYKEMPNLTRQEVMKHAAELWHSSDMNPKNAPAVQEDDVDASRAAGKRRADPKGTPNKGGARTRGRRDDAGGDAAPQSRGVRRMEVDAVPDGNDHDAQQSSAADVDMTGNDVPMSWVAAARRAIGL